MTWIEQQKIITLIRPKREALEHGEAVLLAWFARFKEKWSSTGEVYGGKVEISMPKMICEYTNVPYPERVEMRLQWKFGATVAFLEEHFPDF